MRLLVTRPEPDGERTAAKLRARGHEVMLAPLLRIETVDADLDGVWHAVAVTSANALARHRRSSGAARRCSRCRPMRSAAAPPRPRWRRASPTSSRRTATRRSRAADDDASARRRMRVLYLAGEDRAGDLAGELAAAGIEVATARGLSRRSRCRRFRRTSARRWPPAGSTACCISPAAAPRPISTAPPRPASPSRRSRRCIIACRRRWPSRLTAAGARADPRRGPARPRPPCSA